MAWLHNLAGHAELLLNKIDQNAATVLNDGGSNKLSENIEKEFKEVQSSSSFSEDSMSIPDLTHISLGSFQLQKDQDLTIKIENEIDDLLENVPVNLIYTADSKSNASFDLSKDVGPRTGLSTTSSKSDFSNSFSAAEDVQKYIEKISKLEFENESLNKQLLNFQHLYAEMRNETVMLKNNMERANELVTVSEYEMEKYKAKAHRILQEKEKLLTLKTGLEVQENPEENIFRAYNEELKKELEFHQEQNKRLVDKINNLTSNHSSLQQQYVVMQNSLQQLNQKTESNLAKERKLLLSVEDECKQTKQELQFVNQKLTIQQDEIKVKMEEVNQLKLILNQLSSTTSNEELELRIQSLTQTLMIKQNTLETVTSERNGLRIQLEKLQHEYNHNLTVVQRSQDRLINVNDTDDNKLQIPQFMRVSPLDAGVTRRVKHAYSTLDALSVRTGIFLRRYPVARVFVFCYMVLLHIWVLFILLNYAPSGR